ncbi:unnamed protein product [Linum tenue]|uniref:Uncharacterized protein n=1 Tax=Linum tenue TaxID=586396 RepID=A0AAV0MFM2_9ROSI|nr:unnamed protein product [Linum tenue]
MKEGFVEELNRRSIHELWAEYKNKFKA